MHTSAGDRWDEIWAERGGRTEPSAFVLSAARLLPAAGVALDVAGGTGRHAVWMAEQDLDVSIVDASPVGLEMAEALALSRGVSIRSIVQDLELEGLPRGTWDVVLIHHFLDREVLSSVPSALNPGGVLLFCQPTVRNLERHDRPGRRFLLEEGELGALVETMPLDIELLEESWGEQGRHEARLVGRRPA